MNELSIAKALEQALNKKLKSYKDSLGEYETIDLAEPTKYEKLSTKVMSEEEIAKKASSELANEYESGRKAILSDIGSNIATLNNSKSVLGEKEKNAINNIEKAYESLSEDYKKDALKRGLGRSSIVLENLSAIGAEKAKSILKEQDETQTQIAAIDTKIGKLNASIKAALDNFDLKYASALSDKIQSLSEKQNELRNKAIEYNNDLIKLENEQNLEYGMAKSDSAYKNEKLKLDKTQSETKYGYSEEKKANIEARYDVAYKFYMGLPTNIAKQLFTANTSLPAFLGSYYDKLKKQVEKR